MNIRIPIPKEIKVLSHSERAAEIVLEGLYPGYGITIGNAMRRVLLSSLPGAAITSFRIVGVPHEFSTIPGIVEDVVDISLNLKRVRLKVFTDEAVLLELKAKGENKIKAGDITQNSAVEIINPETHIATITGKGTSLEMTLKAEKGIGYLPIELRKKEKLPVAEIALDALFNPVTKANFYVENMRVGDRTDYNRLRLTVETDGTMDPLEAIQETSSIITEHFENFTALKLDQQAPKTKTVKRKSKPKA
jgi:DNA-directed RNA polymerase subunit alpha